MSKKISPESTASAVVAEFVHSDVFDEYRRRMDERCSLHEKQIAALETCQKNIDKKITATLVFVIITLTSILTAIGLGVFK